MDDIINGSRFLRLSSQLTKFRFKPGRPVYILGLAERLTTLHNHILPVYHHLANGFDPRTLDPAAYAPPFSAGCMSMIGHPGEHRLPSGGDLLLSSAYASYVANTAKYQSELSREYPIGSCIGNSGHPWGAVYGLPSS